MGGTLSTACPQCGSFGVCAHSSGYVPVKEFESLEQKLKTSMEHEEGWKKAAMRKPKPKPKLKEGVWVAHNLFSARVFKAEIDALRYAYAGGDVVVAFVEFGELVNGDGKEPGDQ